MEADFSGYATKAGLKCSDGRTIMPDAFKHQDTTKVPLVWQHGHNDPENVLGHALLENREDGVYAFGFFNSSGKAEHARGLVEHGDISMMSIWANDLIERAGRVLHGAIREVSLVLSGANPGALIENVTIRHSNDEESVLEDEAIIYTGLAIRRTEPEPALSHADEDEDEDDDGETVQDVYDSMSEKQKNVLHYMIGEALESAGAAEHSNVGNDEKDDNNDDQKGSTMKHNVFENDAKPEGTPSVSLSHSDMAGIVADATKSGSLKEAVENYALAHGIENLELLFPEARNLDGGPPAWIKRQTEWVGSVLGGARKSPFTRIKTMTADLTFEEARAKGYIKGHLKKEEFFSVSRRITTPQTIYKKQKLDRDDMIDITDFDVVAWLKGEMRIMLDEELARAVLVGDGRAVDDEDKIQEQYIRPIAKDDPFYTITVNVNLNDANSTYQEVVDAFILNRQFYKGSGNPTLFTTETHIGRFMLLKDTTGRRIYNNMAELTSELRVSNVVTVEILDDYPDILGILVNMNDYVIGSDKGGNVTLFDDFDIDYNQYKYLIETRVSGALTKPRSAVVFTSTTSGDVATTVPAPEYDSETWTVTVPTSTGVEYRNADTGAVLTDGEDIVLAAGDVLTMQAYPADGYYLNASKTRWSYLRPTGS